MRAAQVEGASEQDGERELSRRERRRLKKRRQEERRDRLEAEEAEVDRRAAEIAAEALARVEGRGGGSGRTLRSKDSLRRPARYQPWYKF